MNNINESYDEVMKIADLIKDHNDEILGSVESIRMVLFNLEIQAAQLHNEIDKKVISVIAVELGKVMEDVKKSTRNLIANRDNFRDDLNAIGKYIEMKEANKNTYKK